MTKKEVWKDVIGYEGLYKVSNLGRVRSVKRIAYFGRSYGKRTIGGCLITIQTDKRGKGYLIAGLKKDGKQKNKKVHQLVAKAFIPNPKNRIHINHKDGNPKNCHVDNLEWTTPKENAEHARKLGLIPSGENNGMAKLSDGDIRYIRSKYACGEMTQVALAKRFKVRQGSISNIVLFRSRRETSCQKV